MNILKKLFGSKPKKAVPVVCDSEQNSEFIKKEKSEAVKQYFRKGLFNKFVSVLVTVCFIISIVNLPVFAKSDKDRRKTLMNNERVMKTGKTDEGGLGTENAKTAMDRGIGLSVRDSVKIDKMTEEDIDNEIDIDGENGVIRDRKTGKIVKNYNEETGEVIGNAAEGEDGARKTIYYQALIDKKKAFESSRIGNKNEDKEKWNVETIGEEQREEVRSELSSEEISNADGTVIGEYNSEENKPEVAQETGITKRDDEGIGKDKNDKNVVTVEDSEKEEDNVLSDQRNEKEITSYGVGTKATNDVANAFMNLFVAGAKIALNGTTKVDEQLGIINKEENNEQQSYIVGNEEDLDRAFINAGDSPLGDKEAEVVTTGTEVEEIKTETQPEAELQQETLNITEVYGERAVEIFDEILEQTGLSYEQIYSELQKAGVITKDKLESLYEIYMENKIEAIYGSEGLALIKEIQGNIKQSGQEISISEIYKELERAGVTKQDLKDVAPTLLSQLNNGAKIINCAARALYNVLKNAISIVVLAIRQLAIDIVNGINGIFLQNNSAESKQIMTSMYAQKEVLKSYGVEAEGYECNIDAFIEALQPGESAIIWVNENHYITVTKEENGSFSVMDSGNKVNYNATEFKELMNNQTVTVLTSSKSVAEKGEKLSDDKLKTIAGAGWVTKTIQVPYIAGWTPAKYEWRPIVVLGQVVGHYPVLIELPKPIIKTKAKPIKVWVPDPPKPVQKMLDKVKDVIKNPPKPIKDILDKAKDVVNNPQKAVNDLVNAAKNPQKAINDLIDKGKELIKPITDPIDDAILQAQLDSSGSGYQVGRDDQGNQTITDPTTGNVVNTNDFEKPEDAVDILNKAAILGATTTPGGKLKLPNGQEIDQRDILDSDSYSQVRDLCDEIKDLPNPSSVQIVPPTEPGGDWSIQGEDIEGTQTYSDIKDSDRGLGGFFDDLAYVQNARSADPNCDLTVGVNKDPNHPSSNGTVYFYGDSLAGGGCSTQSIRDAATKSGKTMEDFILAYNTAHDSGTDLSVGVVDGQLAYIGANIYNPNGPANVDFITDMGYNAIANYGLAYSIAYNNHIVMRTEGTDYRFYDGGNHIVDWVEINVGNTNALNAFNNRYEIVATSETDVKFTRDGKHIVGTNIDGEIDITAGIFADGDTNLANLRIFLDGYRNIMGLGPEVKISQYNTNLPQSWSWDTAFNIKGPGIVKYDDDENKYVPGAVRWGEVFDVDSEHQKVTPKGEENGLLAQYKMLKGGNICIEVDEDRKPIGYYDSKKGERVKDPNNPQQDLAFDTDATTFSKLKQVRKTECREEAANVDPTNQAQVDAYLKFCDYDSELIYTGSDVNGDGILTGDEAKFYDDLWINGSDDTYNYNDQTYDNHRKAVARRDFVDTNYSGSYDDLKIEYSSGAIIDSEGHGYMPVIVPTSDDPNDPDYDEVVVMKGFNATNPCTVHGAYGDYIVYGELDSITFTNEDGKEETIDFIRRDFDDGSHCGFLINETDSIYEAPAEGSGGGSGSTPRVITSGILIGNEKGGWTLTGAGSCFSLIDGKAKLIGIGARAYGGSQIPVSIEDSDGNTHSTTVQVSKGSCYVFTGAGWTPNSGTSSFRFIGKPEDVRDFIKACFEKSTGDKIVGNQLDSFNFQGEYVGSFYNIVGIMASAGVVSFEIEGRFGSDGIETVDGKTAKFTVTIVAGTAFMFQCTSDTEFYIPEAYREDLGRSTFTVKAGGYATLAYFLAQTGDHINVNGVDVTGAPVYSELDSNGKPAKGAKIVGYMFSLVNPLTCTANNLNEDTLNRIESLGGTAKWKEGSLGIVDFRADDVSFKVILGILQIDGVTMSAEEYDHILGNDEESDNDGSGSTSGDEEDGSINDLGMFFMSGGCTREGNTVKISGTFFNVSSDVSFEALIGAMNAPKSTYNKGDSAPNGAVITSEKGITIKKDGSWSINGTQWWDDKGNWSWDGFKGWLGFTGGQIYSGFETVNYWFCQLLDTIAEGLGGDLYSDQQFKDWQNNISAHAYGYNYDYGTNSDNVMVWRNGIQMTATEATADAAAKVAFVTAVVIASICVEILSLGTLTAQVSGILASVVAATIEVSMAAANVYIAAKAANDFYDSYQLAKNGIGSWNDVFLCGLVLALCFIPSVASVLKGNGRIAGLLAQKIGGLGKGIEFASIGSKFGKLETWGLKAAPEITAQTGAKSIINWSEMGLYSGIKKAFNGISFRSAEGSLTLVSSEGISLISVQGAKQIGSNIVGMFTNGFKNMFKAAAVQFFGEEAAAVMASKGIIEGIGEVGVGTMLKNFGLNSIVGIAATGRGLIHFGMAINVLSRVYDVAVNAWNGDPWFEEVSQENPFAEAVADLKGSFFEGAKFYFAMPFILGFMSGFLKEGVKLADRAAAGASEGSMSGLTASESAKMFGTQAAHNGLQIVLMNGLGMDPYLAQIVSQFIIPGKSYIKAESREIAKETQEVARETVRRNGGQTRSYRDLNGREYMGRDGITIKEGSEPNTAAVEIDGKLVADNLRTEKDVVEAITAGRAAKKLGIDPAQTYDAVKDLAKSLAEKGVDFYSRHGIERLLDLIDTPTFKDSINSELEKGDDALLNDVLKDNYYRVVAAENTIANSKSLSRIVEDKLVGDRLVGENKVAVIDVVLKYGEPVEGNENILESTLKINVDKLCEVENGELKNVYDIAGVLKLSSDIPGLETIFNKNEIINKVKEFYREKGYENEDGSFNSYKFIDDVISKKDKNLVSQILSLSMSSDKLMNYFNPESFIDRLQSETELIKDAMFKEAIENKINEIIAREYNLNTIGTKSVLSEKQEEQINNIKEKLTDAEIASIRERAIREVAKDFEMKDFEMKDIDVLKDKIYEKNVNDYIDNAIYESIKNNNGDYFNQLEFESKKNRLSKEERENLEQRAREDYIKKNKELENQIEINKSVLSQLGIFAIKTHNKGLIDMVNDKIEAEPENSLKEKIRKYGLLLSDIKDIEVTENGPVLIFKDSLVRIEFSRNDLEGLGEEGAELRDIITKKIEEMENKKEEIEKEIDTLKQELDDEMIMEKYGLRNNRYIRNLEDTIESLIESQPELKEKQEKLKEKQEELKDLQNRLDLLKGTKESSISDVVMKEGAKYGLDKVVEKLVVHDVEAAKEIFVEVFKNFANEYWKLFDDVIIEVLEIDVKRIEELNKEIEKVEKQLDETNRLNIVERKKLEKELENLNKELEKICKEEIGNKLKNEDIADKVRNAMIEKLKNEVNKGKDLTYEQELAISLKFMELHLIGTGEAWMLTIGKDIPEDAFETDNNGDFKGFGVLTLKESSGKSTIDQAILVIENHFGNISAVQAGGGKSLANYMAINMYFDMVEGANVAEYMGAKTTDSSQFVGETNQIMQNLINVKTVDGSELYKEAKKTNDYSEIIDAYKNENNDRVVISFALGDRAFVETTAVKNAKLFDALNNVDMRIFDEADVAALSRQSFITSSTGKPIDRSVVNEIGEIRETIVDALESVGEVDSYQENIQIDITDGIETNKFAYEDGEIIVGESLRSALKDRGIDIESSEAKAVRASQIMRAMWTIEKQYGTGKGKGSELITFDEEGQPGTSAGGEDSPGTKDQSPSYNVGLAFEVQARQIEGLEHVDPFKITESESSAEAIISAIARHHRPGKQALNAASSATMEDAGPISQVIYGGEVTKISSSDMDTIVNKQLGEYVGEDYKAFIRSINKNNWIEGQGRFGSFSVDRAVIIEQGVNAAADFLENGGAKTEINGKEIEIGILFGAMDMAYNNEVMIRALGRMSNMGEEAFYKEVVNNTKGKKLGEVLDYISKNYPELREYTNKIQVIDSKLAGENAEKVSSEMKDAGGKLTFSNVSGLRGVDYRDINMIILDGHNFTAADLYQAIGRAGRKSSWGKDQARVAVFMEENAINNTLKEIYDVANSDFMKGRALFTEADSISLEGMAELFANGKVPTIEELNGLTDIQKIELVTAYKSKQAQSSAILFKANQEISGVLRKNVVVNLIRYARKNGLTEEVAFLENLYVNILSNTEGNIFAKNVNSESEYVDPLTKLEESFEQQVDLAKDMYKKILEGCSDPYIRWQAEQYLERINDYKSEGNPSEGNPFDIKRQKMQQNEEYRTDKTFVQINDNIAFDSENPIRDVAEVLVDLSDNLLPTKNSMKEFSELKVSDKVKDFFEKDNFESAEQEGLVVKEGDKYYITEKGRMFVDLMDRANGNKTFEQLLRDYLVPVLINNDDDEYKQFENNYINSKILQNAQIGDKYKYNYIEEYKKNHPEEVNRLKQEAMMLFIANKLQENGITNTKGLIAMFNSALGNPEMLNGIKTVSQLKNIVNAKHPLGFEEYVSQNPVTSWLSKEYNLPSPQTIELMRVNDVNNDNKIVQQYDLVVDMYYNENARQLGNNVEDMSTASKLWQGINMIPRSNDFDNELKKLDSMINPTISEILPNNIVSEGNEQSIINRIERQMAIANIPVNNDTERAIRNMIKLGKYLDKDVFNKLLKNMKISDIYKFNKLTLILELAEEDDELKHELSALSYNQIKNLLEFRNPGTAKKVGKKIGSGLVGMVNKGPIEKATSFVSKKLDISRDTPQDKSKKERIALLGIDPYDNKDNDSILQNLAEYDNPADMLEAINGNSGLIPAIIKSDMKETKAIAYALAVLYPEKTKAEAMEKYRVVEKQYLERNNIRVSEVDDFVNDVANILGLSSDQKKQLKEKIINLLQKDFMEGDRLCFDGKVLLSQILFMLNALEKGDISLDDINNLLTPLLSPSMGKILKANGKELELTTVIELFINLQKEGILLSAKGSGVSSEEMLYLLAMCDCKNMEDIKAVVKEYKENGLSGLVEKGLIKKENAMLGNKNLKLELAILQRKQLQEQVEAEKQKPIWNRKRTAPMEKQIRELEREISDIIEEEISYLMSAIEKENDPAKVEELQNKLAEMKTIAKDISENKEDVYERIEKEELTTLKMSDGKILFKTTNLQELDDNLIVKEAENELSGMETPKEKVNYIKNKISENKDNEKVVSSLKALLEDSLLQDMNEGKITMEGVKELEQDLEEDLNKLETEKAQLKRDIDSVVENDEEYKSLKEEYDSVEKEYYNIPFYYEESKQKLEQMENLKNQMNRVREQIINRSKELTAKEKRISEIEEKETDLQEEISLYNEIIIKPIMETIEQEKEDKKAGNEKIKKLNEEIETAEEKHNSLISIPVAMRNEEEINKVEKGIKDLENRKEIVEALSEVVFYFEKITDKRYIGNEEIMKKIYEKIDSLLDDRILSKAIVGVTKPQDVSNGLKALFALFDNPDDIAEMFGYNSIEEVGKKGSQEDIIRNYFAMLGRAETESQVELLGVARDMLLMICNNKEDQNAQNSIIKAINEANVDELTDKFIEKKAVNMNCIIDVVTKQKDGDFVIDLTKIKEVVEKPDFDFDMKAEDLLKKLASAFDSGNRNSNEKMKKSLMSLSNIHAIQAAA